MKRYSKITTKNQREIVLLKGRPCIWGKCNFCDYINDNSLNNEEICSLNEEILDKVTGEYGKLEVINSGSVFELPSKTLELIKKTTYKRSIHTLYFESYYAYKYKLQSLREYFKTKIIFKCGIETFDNHFRNNILNKGIYFNDPKEISRYFDAICLLVGIQGQTKKMIQNDIEYLLKYFTYGCINIYNNNSTHIKEDPSLSNWFKQTYSYLENYPNLDILWNNTDFGVGGEHT